MLTRTFDLAALGLLPRPVPPGDAAALALADALADVWGAWFDAARVWPRAWLALLDAAERAGGGR